ncbi:hypothetical protein ELK16_28550, partial [Klebsiella pneumoniae]|nr:hypothetical protein [Klebsiella pneumoniae]
ADRNRSHWSTSKTPSYTKSVSWQHHPPPECRAIGKSIAKYTHRNFTPETFAQYVADTHTLTYVFVPLALTPR